MSGIPTSCLVRFYPGITCPLDSLFNEPDPELLVFSCIPLFRLVRVHIEFALSQVDLHLLLSLQTHRVPLSLVSDNTVISGMDVDPVAQLCSEDASYGMGTPSLSTVNC